MRSLLEKASETGYLDGTHQQALDSIIELLKENNITYRLNYLDHRSLILVMDGLIEIFVDDVGRNTLVVQHTDGDVASNLCRQLCFYICGFRPDNLGLAQLSKLMPKAE